MQDEQPIQIKSIRHPYSSHQRQATSVIQLIHHKRPRDAFEEYISAIKDQRFKHKREMPTPVGDMRKLPYKSGILKTSTNHIY